MDFFFSWIEGKYIYVKLSNDIYDKLDTDRLVKILVIYGLYTYGGKCDDIIRKNNNDGKISYVRLDHVIDDIINKRDQNYAIYHNSINEIFNGFKNIYSYYDIIYVKKKENLQTFLEGIINTYPYYNEIYREGNKLIQINNRIFDFYKFDIKSRKINGKYYITFISKNIDKYKCNILINNYVEKNIFPQEINDDTDSDDNGLKTSPLYMEISIEQHGIFYIRNMIIQIEKKAKCIFAKIEIINGRI